MYRRFSVLIILRVLLLIGTIFLLAFIFGDTRLLFNHIILATVIILQVWELIHFLNQTNRELARLFLAIRHQDFSITFNQGPKGKSFQSLQESLTEIISAYKEVKLEKEAQYHFLQHLVNQLHVGIIAIQGNEEISIINSKAQQLLQATGIKNLSLLKQQHLAFMNEVNGLGESGRKLIELKQIDSTLVSLEVSTLLILGSHHKLITFQDINSEIEQKEIEAWHKLIRILTHEIMNSITPISSLTETMGSMLEDKAGGPKSAKDMEDEIISDLRISVSTIQKRSEGLIQFVDNYRKFSRVPKPMLSTINISELLHSISQLMQRDLDENKLHLQIDISDKSLEVAMDKTLIEQVLINLVTNSIHALENRPDPLITLAAYTFELGAVLEVSDNGKGISEKDLPSIFIPFFSTKQEGSGIGLSLSKQIMNAHGGSIKVQSTLNEGTRFMLTFK